VRVATRNPSAVSTQFSNLVELDYDRPATFLPAVTTVEKVFLTVRPGDNHSDEAAAPLIDAAKRAGVRHIVALTAMGVEQDETFMLRKLETYIEASGMAWTFLRPNWFMQNFDSGPMYAEIIGTGSLHLPAGDAKISFIDVRDIASVGLSALTEPRHTGKAYTLTGGESLNHFQVMDKLSKCAGKNLSFVPISAETARQALQQRGVPADLIQRWDDFYQKVRQGLCAPVFPDTETILGRPPTTFDQYVCDYAGAWR